MPPGEPSALADLRPLPFAGFENATDLLEVEGETYFWCGGCPSELWDAVSGAACRRHNGMPSVRGCSDVSTETSTSVARGRYCLGWWFPQQLAVRGQSCVEGERRPSVVRGKYWCSGGGAHLLCHMPHGFTPCRPGVQNSAPTCAGPQSRSDLLSPTPRLYRTLLNFEASLGCFIANSTSWVPPPGWDLHAMLNLTEPASNTEGAPAGPAPGTVVLPFAAVLLNQEEEQLVVAVRGTQTAAEWGIDFSYNQTADVAALGGLPVHYVFASVFQQLWPAVQAALDELVAGESPAAKQACGWGCGEGQELWGMLACGLADGVHRPSLTLLTFPAPMPACLSRTTQVFVTGHSLGAGVGTLVSYAAQSYLNQQMGAAAPVVGAVLTAPPNAGSPEFVNAFNQLVNARRLAFEYDIVPQVRSKGVDYMLSWFNRQEGMCSSSASVTLAAAS